LQQGTDARVLLRSLIILLLGIFFHVTQKVMSAVKVSFKKVKNCSGLVHILMDVQNHVKCEALVCDIQT